MTIRVYAVRPDGSTVTVQERRRIEPNDGPPATLRYPPCSCSRCAAREADQ